MKNKLWLFAPAALAAALSTAALGVALAGAAGQRAAAGPVPTTVAYQGFLTDVRGTPVPNGARTITFRLYGSPTGGSALWQETQTLTTDRGVFNAMLGSASAFGDTFDTAPLYLGVQPAGEAELRPRQQLAATPFALRAADADSLGGAPASAFVRNAGTGLQAVQALGQRALGLDPDYRLPQGCEPGKVAKWGFTGLNSQGWICGPDVAGDDIDVASLQQRVTGRCSGNRAIVGIEANGAAVCSQRFPDFQDVLLPVIETRRVEATDRADRDGQVVAVAACPAGWTVTGGGVAGVSGDDYATFGRPQGQGWYAGAVIDSGETLTVHANCIRLTRPARR